jgi:hypothetical protein
VLAAKNFRKLRARGITVRKTIDTVIATRCIFDGLELLHSDRPEGRGPFTPIGLTTTTDRAGRWSFSLSDPVRSQDFFAAIAAASGLASSPTSVCGNQAAP